MAEGLKNATLATIRTQGPWATSEGLVTGDQVAEAYLALERGDYAGALRAVGALGASSRRWDRAIQRLKRAGLVRFDRSANRWAVT